MEDMATERQEKSLPLESRRNDAWCTSLRGALNNNLGASLHNGHAYSNVLR